MKELNGYVKHTLDVAQAAGEDLAPYLALLGVGYTDLGETEDCVEQATYNQLLDLLIARRPNEGLGLIDGLGVSILDHGLLGYAMFASENLERAIERHTKYQDVIGAALHTRLIVDQNRALLRVTNIARPELINTPAKLRYETERLLAQWAEIGPAFGQPKHWYQHINIAFEKPQDCLERYFEILGGSIQFSSCHTEIVFNRSLLKAPFQHANEQAAMLCEQQCAALLRQLNNTEGVVARVRRLLAASPGAAPTIVQVAESLGLSERTLRRKLADEGTNYKSVILDFRMELAASYLKGNEMSIQEIAFTVGYSDPSNFHRAFCQRFDTTPAVFREENRAA